MDEKIKVSGCIVTYNNSEIITACVESLLKWTQNMEFRLYIVDNNSSDSTVEMVRSKFPNVEVIENRENSGFGDGHNKILNKIDSKYHFVINPDIFIDHDVISELVNYMESHEDVAMITPRIMNEDGSEQLLPKKNPTIRYLIISKFRPFKHYRNMYTRADEQLKDPTEIDFCTGCFFGIRSDIFKALNGFDSRYFMYMEDADLSREVRKGGKIIFYPDTYVFHEWKRDNVKNIRGIFRWFSSMVKYFFKWGWKF